MNDSFLRAFQIERGDVVSIVGAGGKTSLLYLLAEEARGAGMKVLVTTSTRIFIPRPDQYTAIDLSGDGFSPPQMTGAGIYVAGVPDAKPRIMRGIAGDQVVACKEHFNLIIIEADGSARKPLKGWKDTEPVIHPQTSKTIGVLDIQTIGQAITSELIHSLDIFLELVGVDGEEKVSLKHLAAIVSREKGLFAKAQGSKHLFINKVETRSQQRDAQMLKQRLMGVHTVSGSLHQGIIYE
jgi:probable selenium-dependent hydroxylase accessory protein YqeC